MQRFRKKNAKESATEGVLSVKIRVICGKQKIMQVLISLRFFAPFASLFNERGARKSAKESSNEGVLSVKICEICGNKKTPSDEVHND
jgi:hypothetical protein